MTYYVLYYHQYTENNDMYSNVEILHQNICYKCHNSTCVCFQTVCVRNNYPVDGSTILYILYMCGVASNCLQEGAPSYPRGRIFPTSSDAVIIQFGWSRLRGRVKVNCVAMVRVSKLLGSNINPNPNSNSALTLIMTLNSH